MKNLKILREKKGYKQEVIANFLNISITAYSRYELGQRNMTPDTLIKLSEFFDVSVDYLIDLIDVPLTVAENEVLRNLDDPEAILKKEFNLKLSGETLSEDEARKMLQFLKMLRDK